MSPEEAPPHLYDPLFDKPEGFVEDLGGGMYLVKGRSRGYGVNWNEKTCGCPQHQYRMAPGELCRHLEVLQAHLESTAAELDDDALEALYR